MNSIGETLPMGERSSSAQVRLIEIDAAILLVALLIFTVIRLWPDWLQNPDLSHGIVTPLVFVILVRRIGNEFFDARLHADAPTESRLHVDSAFAIFSGVVGLVLFLGANLYAAALEWSHSLVLSLLGIATGLFVASVLIGLGVFRSVHVARWPVLVAALIWPLSAPIPPGSYTRLTQTLQSAISAGVLPVLHFLGVAAERVGNVIVLAHVSVGVEEACSGVRSLVSCIFAALFLSAVAARKTSSRIVLVALAAPFAVGMNFLRSLILTLLANAGVNIEAGWHDATGYAILLVTALLLLGAARLLERSTPSSQTFASANGHAVFKTSRHEFAAGTRAPLLTAVVALSAAAALWLLFTVRTHPQSPLSQMGLEPRIDALIPTSAPGWDATTRNDLYQFSAELRTRFLVERSFTRTRNGREEQVTIYVAFWPAGGVPVSLVEAHTPDACWPGGGWVEDAARHRHTTLQVDTHTLPLSEFRLFQLDGYPQNVWYWHLFDGQVIQQNDTASALALLSLAWHYGFRKDGDQYFVRISSNQSWEEISRDPLVRDTVKRLQSIGL